MEAQDTKFNYKIILAALVAVIIGLLIAFYFSYAQSQNQIIYLEEEKALLVKDLTLLRTEVDRLAALDEVNEIELQDSRYEVQKLLDSVGKLSFTVAKLSEYKEELRKLEAKHDSLKLKNNFLKYNNSVLSNKYEATKKKIKGLQGSKRIKEETGALLERQKVSKPKIKEYLKLNGIEATGFRIRGAGRPIRTNKASAISKLRGCVTIVGSTSKKQEERILYLQFLDPNKKVIEDKTNTISVNGNTYSKRVVLIFIEHEFNVCDYISVPEGSLNEGTYTLNVFEEEKLLISTEFLLK